MKIYVQLKICLLVVMAINIGLGQEVYRGKIMDLQSGEVMVAANIANGQYNTASDALGLFAIEAMSGDTLRISYVSYEELIVIVSNEHLKAELNELLMQPSSSILETATITSSRYNQRLSDAVISIDVLKPRLLKSVNTVRMDDVLNKVPGVQVIDGQANIRGGSGYSYGAGSRVMLLIDGLPALQTDAGFPNWTDIPVENVGQVEVMKGSGSALYGSSALNGIINILRARPGADPETEVSLGYISYFSPKDERKKWWKEGDLHPHGTNASIVHRRREGKLEMTGSVFYRKLESFNQETMEDRNRIALNVRYNMSDQVSFGLNSTFNNAETASFFVWRNPVGGAFTPYDGSLSTAEVRRYMIDPFLYVRDNHGGKHSLLGRFMSIDNNNNMNQSNSSQNTYFEYQYQNEITNPGINLTGGLVHSFTNSDAQLFGDTTFTSRNNALYVQADKQWKKLTFTVGGRFEYNQQKSPENFMGNSIPDGISSDRQPIFRTGINYKLHEYSSLRASWGQGYRFPTVTERFITTAFSGFLIFPNVDLQPEEGWTSEIGWKQGLSFLGFKGFVDVAGFWSEYKNMMEFTLVDIGGLGFQSQNIGDTRIIGGEISVFGQAHLAGIPINIYGGYTYIDPIYKDFNSIVQGSSSSDENILKYRSRQNYKLDIEGLYKGFTFGTSIQSASHVVAIDAALRFLGGAGIEDYRSVNNNGFKTFDIRLGYQVAKLKVSTILANILNEEYTLRPALMEAPRNITIRLDYKI